MRNIGRSAIAVGLTGGACAATAEPREPLVISSLAEPRLVPVDTGDGGDPAEQARQRLSLTIAQAIQEDQRSIEQACRSRAASTSTAARRYDWQASCLYRRR